MRLPEDVKELGVCEVSHPTFCLNMNSKNKTLLLREIAFSELFLIVTFLFGVALQYTMDRGVVHACHAGGVVHSLEGWTHHEVGAIDVERIDIVWKAALKHGLKPVSSN